MPGTKPGGDKPTGRVRRRDRALDACWRCLRGHLPAKRRECTRGGRRQPSGACHVATRATPFALIALAIITRLRHPLPVAPSAGGLSAMLGGSRANWRVLLLRTITAWLRCDTAGTVVRTRSVLLRPPAGFNRRRTLQHLARNRRRDLTMTTCSAFSLPHNRPVLTMVVAGR